MVAVVYNVVLFQSIQTLSSVGTAILGNIKIVCLLFLSSLLLGELDAWSANQYLGCLLTFCAAFAYSYLKATANRPALDRDSSWCLDARSSRRERRMGRGAYRTHP